MKLSDAQIRALIKLNISDKPIGCFWLCEGLSTLNALMKKKMVISHREKVKFFYPAKNILFEITYIGQDYLKNLPR